MKPLFGVPSLIYYQIDDYKPNPKPNYECRRTTTAYNDNHSWIYLDQLKCIKVCTKCNLRQIKIDHDDKWHDFADNLLLIYMRRFLGIDYDNTNYYRQCYQSTLIRNKDFKWPVRNG